jgi:hypothetical protein
MIFSSTIFRRSAHKFPEPVIELSICSVENKHKSSPELVEGRTTNGIIVDKDASTDEGPSLYISEAMTAHGSGEFASELVDRAGDGGVDNFS